MNTHTAGEKAGAPRPRREKSMLDRALEYSKLSKGGMTDKEIGRRFKENPVTVNKLVRLGDAPKSVISLIRKGVVPATVISNNIKASMTDADIVALVQEEIDRREDARKKLREAGFKGASSMTLRRAFTIAVDNLRKRKVLKNEGRKAVVRTLSDLLNRDGKLMPSDIEEAILMN